MSAALGTFLRIINHMQQFTGIFLWRSHIYQTTPRILEAVGYIFAIGAYALIHWRGVIGRSCEMRNFLGHWALFRLPLTASTIHDLHVFMAIHGEQPVRITGVPVVFIAIEDNGCIIGNPPTAH